MEDIKSFKEGIFYISKGNFEDYALRLFRFQAGNNEIYRKYIDSIGVDVSQVKRVNEIPFLPISLFRYYPVKTGNWMEETVFYSSGTTSVNHSRHFIQSIDFYYRTSQFIFEQFFGAIKDYLLLTLLPSYREQKNSSLINMVDHFVKQTGERDSGFYLSDKRELLNRIKRLRFQGNRKIILWGVTYALLDLAEMCDFSLRDVLIFETGGMKGRREELVKAEVHRILMDRFKVSTIYAEYGMTELLSQAYSKGKGIFHGPAWMKVMLRDINDPFHVDNKLKYGGINVIDLANIHSCAFIATEDLGCIAGNNGFEVIGRLDNSDIRGCNLLIN